MNAPMTKAENIATSNVPALICALRAEFDDFEDNIPLSLKKLKGWFVWKTTAINPDTGKFNKIPIYPRFRKKRQGMQGSEEDLQNLGTWTDARIALNSDRSVAGVGFAMLPSFGMVALDVDHCIKDGKVREDVLHLTKDTYCEISPSGTGVRAFWQGAASDGKNHSEGFELFHSKGFVTVTGNVVKNEYHRYNPSNKPLPMLDADMRTNLEKLSCSTGKVAKVSISKRLKEAGENDSRLQAIHDAGLYERDMGDGKHSICCPFEDMHSDFGRNAGDGDTIYFQPHTNGYAEGWIHCLHTHGNDQGKYWETIGYDLPAEAFKELMFENLDAQGWPSPQPLPNDLPPVPQFDLSLLPITLRPWIEDIAERMQVGSDIPAIGAITALSAAIGRRVQIMPKAYDDWTVVPNLWGLVVAPPGYMKSPALSEVMKPLHRLESEAYREYESARATWVVEKETMYRVFERVVGREPFQDLTTGEEEFEVPDVRRFDSEAQAAFYGWLEQLERLVRGNSLPPVMASHLSKYRSLVPALALIFAIVDGEQGAIPLRYVEQAIGWATYLRAHAERAFSCSTRPDTRYARALLVKIKEGIVVDGFKPADVYLKGWSLLDQEGVTKAVNLLSDLDYLLRVEKRPNGGGRPSVTYRINPNA